MGYSAKERLAFHRAGQSSDARRRADLSSLEAIGDSGEQRVFSSKLPTITAAAAATDVIYWVYVGRVNTSVSIANVEFAMTTAAAGAQVAELALASSPSAPNRAAQTLTCLAVKAAVTDLTVANAVKRATTAFGYVVKQKDVGLYLWAACRFDMETTQPTIFGHTGDMSDGQILSTASTAAIAAGSTYTGALITHALTWQAPALRVTLD